MAVDIVSCDKIKNDIKHVNLSTELLATMACIEFTTKTNIGGTQGDNTFSFLEVRFETCNQNLHG